MKILVTGGLGVNGCWVTRRLLESGHEPVVLDVRDDRSLLRDVATDFEFVQADITDTAAMPEILKSRRIERICHLAAIYPDACDENPMQGFRINALATVNLLEAARQTGIRRFIYTSSVGTLAPVAPDQAGHPVDESHPADPSGSPGVYGATKVASELMGQNYQRLFGLEFAALRFSSIFGPGKVNPRLGNANMSVWGRIVSSALAGQPVKLPGGADEQHDVVYARDVAQSVVLACLAEKLPHNVYHIGAGRSYSLAELCERVKLALPDAKIELGNAGSGRKFPPWVMDISRAQRDLNYQPEFAPERAILDWREWAQKLGLTG